MWSSGAWRLGSAALCAAALALSGAAANRSAASEEERPPPRIYRWVDENGIAHYTTDPQRIPRALRSQIPRAEAPPHLEERELDARAPGPHAPPPLPPPSRAPAPPSPAASATPAPGQRQGALTRSPPDAWAARDRGAPEAEKPAGAEAGSKTSQIDDLDFQIAGLEADIQANEEVLKARISDPEAGGPLARGEDDSFRKIAAQLPRQLEELRKLREQRAALAGKYRGGPPCA